MGSIPCRKYDFVAARSRILLLTMMYRQAKRKEDEMACWCLAAQIEELENEVVEAHASDKSKMTTVASSGHTVMHYENIFAPIIPEWAGANNGGIIQ